MLCGDGVEEHGLVRPLEMVELLGEKAPGIVNRHGADVCAGSPKVPNRYPGEASDAGRGQDGYAGLGTELVRARGIWIDYDP